MWKDILLDRANIASRETLLASVVEICRVMIGHNPHTRPHIHSPTRPIINEITDAGINLSQFL